MVPESQYCQMKARIPEIKQLFHSRRYIQCAAVCERLLMRNYDQIHPVHKAYLHFYFALVNDTMARETTVKHRSSGLDLAEQHYRAAIYILTPGEPYNLDDILSPSSPGSEDEQSARFHRISNNFYHSASSSTTTSDEDEEGTWTLNNNPLSKHAPSSQVSMTSPKTEKRRPAPIMTFNASRAYHEEQFSSDLFAFLSMIHTHLRSVQQLRTAPLTTRVSFTRSRSSTMSSRPESRESSNSSGSERDEVRWVRKSVGLRPRFDPAGIRKLCIEALSEL